VPSEEPNVRRRPKVTRNPVTLHAVAAAAGCSTATVSKALNGLPVSEVNLKRVLAAAHELGYVPNLAARSMRNERSMTLGVALNVGGDLRIEHVETLEPAMAYVESRGYSVLISVIYGTGGADIDTILRRFLAHRVDGLLYFNAKPSPSLELYKQAKIPIIAVGFRDDGCADIPLITADGSAAFKAAVASLKRFNHKVVAEVALAGDELASRLFPKQRGGIRWQELRVENTQDDLRRVLATAVGGRTPPTAVMAGPPTALRMYSVCEELGIRIPDDLSLISVTDPVGADQMRVPLSCIRTNLGGVGQAAGSALMDALIGLPVADMDVVDCVRYIERGSTGPAPLS
jgi:LacI family transcriptional regulator